MGNLELYHVRERKMRGKEHRKPQTGGGDGESSQGAEATERETKRKKREMYRSGHLSARRSQIQPPGSRARRGWLAGGSFTLPPPWEETVEGGETIKQQSFSWGSGVEMRESGLAQRSGRVATCSCSRARAPLPVQAAGAAGQGLLPLPVQLQCSQCAVPL
jgi:hypothetical protein